MSGAFSSLFAAPRAAVVTGVVSGLIYGFPHPISGGYGMRVQRLVMPDGSGSWTVLDDRGEVIAPAEALLAQPGPP